MHISLTERRQIENEMIFRRANEKVSNELTKLNKKYADTGDAGLVKEDNTLHFICECSDENCMERIPMKLSRYRKIHANRKAFIIKPGHEVKAIEEVVVDKPQFAVVEKNQSVVSSNNELHDTDVDNS